MSLRGVIVLVLSSWATFSAQPESKWELVSAPTRKDIRMVQLSADRVWLLGDGELFRRGSDGSWSAPIPLAGDRWTTMIAAGPEQMYGIADGERQTIESLRSGTRTRIGTLERCASHDTVLAAIGSSFAAGCPYYSGLVFWRAADDKPAEDGTLLRRRVR